MDMLTSISIICQLISWCSVLVVNETGVPMKKIPIRDCQLFIKFVPKLDFHILGLFYLCIVPRNQESERSCICVFGISNCVIEIWNCSYSIICFRLITCMNLQLLAKPSSIVSHSFHILALTSDKQENEATIKYCYSDSRNLWAVMKAGGLAL